MVCSLPNRISLEETHSLIYRLAKVQTPSSHSDYRTNLTQTDVLWCSIRRITPWLGAIDRPPAVMASIQGAVGLYASAPGLPGILVHDLHLVSS